MSDPDQKVTEITIKFLFNEKEMQSLRRAVDEMNRHVERLPPNTDMLRIPWSIESELHSAIGMHVYALRDSQRKQDAINAEAAREKTQALGAMHGEVHE